MSALFVRIAYAIESVGAKRLLLDTLEVLFAGFSNVAVMRSEVERLFRWLKERGDHRGRDGRRERGEGTLTRSGPEEYLTACVITLDQRVSDQLTTRRLRVVKYRGSPHGTNEYPFLIGERENLGPPDHEPYGPRLRRLTPRAFPPGIPALDAMLGGKGYFRASSVLVSGTAGTGKEQRRLLLRRRRVHARGPLSLLRARRADGAGRPEHALDRARPETARRPRKARDHRGAPHPPRARTTPRRDARRDRASPAAGGDRRPDLEPPHGGELSRGQVDARS